MERRRKLKVFVEARLAHIARMAGLRKGHAEPSASAQARPADGTETPAEGSGQAGTPSAEHQQRRVEAHPPVGDRSRRKPVSRVRKGRDGKGSAR
jgi:hypothetical protein